MLTSKEPAPAVDSTATTGATLIDRRAPGLAP